MTQPIDYDADLARRLDARLAQYIPLARIGAAPRPSHRLRLVATAALSAVIFTVAGVGIEANAYAETQGLSCLAAMDKVQVFARALSDQYRGASLEEQRAAKARLNEYAFSLTGPACSADNGGWMPKASPSGAAPMQQPPAQNFTKPTNPAPSPSPTGKP
ncbi:MAG TPA: hypothetical protein VEU77_10810 [Candidatus Acidoferrales bacterium]|nr:hypothetical protein [Candidatus Acidoferrales bacterium]